MLYLPNTCPHSNLRGGLSTLATSLLTLQMKVEWNWYSLPNCTSMLSSSVSIPLLSQQYFWNLGNPMHPALKHFYRILSGNTFNNLHVSSTNNPSMIFQQFSLKYWLYGQSSIFSLNRMDVINCCISCIFLSLKSLKLFLAYWMAFNLPLFFNISLKFNLSRLNNKLLSIILSLCSLDLHQSMLGSKFLFFSSQSMVNRFLKSSLN